MVAQSQSIAPEAFFQTTGVDLRADRGRREIAISTDRVTIRRRLQGIDMRLTLAVAAYTGVALCLRPALGGTLFYQVRLVHSDRDLSVVLDEAADDRDIVADWRLWARVLGLPALVERSVDCFEPASDVPAKANATLRCVRRKRALKRRPKFLARRRMGGAVSSQPVFAGEREIIARR